MRIKLPDGRTVEAPSEDIDVVEACRLLQSGEATLVEYHALLRDRSTAYIPGGRVADALPYLQVPE